MSDSDASRTVHDSIAGEIDAIIIGAGVAGAAAAAALAAQVPRARIVLVERASWPRYKVCGCCLNPAGVQLLQELGVAQRIRAAAEAIDSVEIRVGAARLALDHRGGLAIGRSQMDQLLVQHAMDRGVYFSPETQASVVELGPERGHVRLTRDGKVVLVAPRMVIVADGLGGSALRELPRLRPVIAGSSWLGIGSVLDGTPLAQHVRQGQIAMHSARGGYAGLVRLADGKIALAAAIAPARLKRAGTPARAIREIFESCELAMEFPSDVDFRGTPLLTRHRTSLGCAGMLVIGDAAGYVEPFTGEGMTWALASAQRVAGLVTQVLRNESTSQEAAKDWETWHGQHIGSRQRTCRSVRILMHTPGLAGAVVTCAGMFAPIRSLLASKVHEISKSYLPGVSR